MGKTKEPEQSKNPRGVFEKIPGSGTWWINYVVDGTRHREKIGTKSNAIKMYGYRKNQKWEGKKLPATMRMQRVVRFSELIKDVLEYSKAEKKSFRSDQGRATILLERFKDEPAEKITKGRFESFLNAREISPATKNRYRALLKLMYRLAEEEKKITTNPARLLRMKKENNGRVRFIIEEEEKNLRVVMKKKFASHIPELDVALNTGMRRSEQYGLRWSDVDFERRIVNLADTKTGEGRHIPLNDAALAAFRSLEENKKISKFVFLRKAGHGAGEGERLKSPREWFEDAIEEAKIEDFTWHDLRHTFASRLVMAGVDLRTVADLLGHKHIQMTIRYAHLAPEHRADAVRRLSTFGAEKADVITFPRHRSVRKSRTATRNSRGTRTATGPKTGLRVRVVSAG